MLQTFKIGTGSLTISGNEKEINSGVVGIGIDAGLRSTHYTIKPEEARDLAEALHRAADAFNANVPRDLGRFLDTTKGAA
jgi:hypothetical protein